MRKQEFNSKLISLLPLDEVPVHVPLRRPRPLRFARLRVPVWNPYSRGHLSPAKSEDRKGGEGKSRRQSHTFFFSTCCAWHPNSPPRPGEAPHPAPSARKSATRTAQKTALCAPCEHPGGFGIRKSASNSGHSPLRGGGLGGGLGDASPARRGSRSRPPLRRPRPLRFERLRMSGSECGIHTAEAASALRSRKTERAAKEKPTPISQFFLAPAAPGLAIRPEREYVVAHRPFLSFMDRPTVTSRPARLWREVLMALNTTTTRRDGVN